MHLPINVKSLNNISKWQMGFNSAFKGLMSINVNENVFMTITITILVRWVSVDGRATRYGPGFESRGGEIFLELTHSPVKCVPDLFPK
jgi:hypothetical protein